MNAYKKQLEHAERLRAKRERLEGLRALYQTHEELGHEPFPGTEMIAIRRRIARTNNELRAMGEDIGPEEAGP